MVLETLILIASGKISTHKKMHKTNGDICFNRNLQKKLYSTTLVIYLNNYLPPTYGLL